MKKHEAEELATGFRRLFEKMVENDERRNGPAAASDFVADGFLTRDGESLIKAPGIKVTEKMIGVNV